MKKKAWISFGLLGLSAIVATAAVDIFPSDADETVSIQIEQFENSYLLNENFSVPYGKAIVDGSEQAVEHVLIYPDGRRTSYHEAKLDVYGEYKLKYYTTIGGQEYSETKTFSVVAGDYTTLFTDLGGCTFTQNVTVGSWCDYDYFNGVKVDFDSTGGSFRYNGVIDLSTTTKYDEFISFITDMPEWLTTADVGTAATRLIQAVEIKLIDIHDENNYVYINAADQDVYTTRVTTSVNDMYTPYGMVSGEPNAFGPQIYSSLAGKPSGMPTASNAFQLSYVAQEKGLYGITYPERALAPKLILDYDDPTMVEQEYVWEGFTTNQVYMEVSVVPRSANESSLIFMSIGGTDLSGDGNAVSKDVKINVDTFGYSENSLPKATVGREYPVFEATAYDNYGFKMSSVNVAIYDPDGAPTLLKNGRFTSTKAGRYAIVYTASNAYITGSKTVYVEAGTEYDAPIYLISEEIVSEATVGQKISLYEGSTAGGIGNISVARTVKFGEAEIPVYNFGKEDYFYPTQSGDYVVTYTATDQIGNVGTFEKVISVSDGFIPVMELPNFSKVNLVGREVSLPRVSATAHKDEMTIFVPVEVYFDELDVTDTLTYTPQTAGTHTVKYVAKSLAGEAYDAVYEVEIQVNDPAAESNSETPLPLVDNYFWVDGFAKGYSNKAYRLTADGSQETASAQFLTALPQDMLNLTFSITMKKVGENGETLSSYNNFEQVRVRLSDSESANEEIELTLERYTWGGKENVGLYVNGKFVARYDTEFGGTKRFNFGYSYDPETLDLLDADGNVLVKLTGNSQGEAFTGFTSGRVYVTFECAGITGSSELEIDSIGGQVMMQTAKDTTGPVLIGANDSISGSANVYVNEKYEFAKLRAFDVLDGEYCDVFVSIQKGGNYILVSQKLEKNSSFVFEEAGSYTLYYTAKDAGGTSVRRQVNIVAKDFVNPVLQVGKVPTRVGVGKTVTLPKATATDDSSALEKITVYAYITNPSGVRKLISGKDEYKYTFTKAGTYVLRYVAMDDSGNEAVKEFTIVAK